jgi:hypothetical protein
MYYSGRELSMQGMKSREKRGRDQNLVGGH